ncbi:MAG: hypothetical protein ABI843_09065 [Dokdonella sp.]
MSTRKPRAKTAIAKYGGCGVLAALLEVFDAPYPGKEDDDAPPKLRLVHSSDRDVQSKDAQK